MTAYNYYGRDEQGAEVNGVLNKTSSYEVANHLLGRNIIPVRIVEQYDSPSLSLVSFFHYISHKKGVSDEQLLMFCRQMHTIHKSGLSLIEGLDGLANSLPDGSFRLCLSNIVDRLASGYSLSQAMHYHSKIFNHIFISMVTVGENTGDLDQVFKQMGRYIERDIVTRKAIQAAVRYPLFVMISMIVALLLINIMVIPAFETLFSRFGADVPLPTQILLTGSVILKKYSLLILLSLACSAIAFLYWKQTPRGQLRWHHFLLNIPVVGTLLFKGSLSRYTRTFSMMLKANVPLVTAIELCADIVTNHYIAEKIQEIKKYIERGETLFRAHTKSALFPPLVLQMIHLGERSGSVDVLLLEVAESYERDLDYEIKRLSARIEPLLIIIMAIFIGILALGVFLPMWDLFNIQ